jgi:hypothetical protein
MMTLLMCGPALGCPVERRSTVCFVKEARRDVSPNHAEADAAVEKLKQPIQKAT